MTCSCGDPTRPNINHRKRIPCWTYIGDQRHNLPAVDLMKALEDSMGNTGHGHVRPRPDGVKARCGGPAICAQCARESAQSGRADG